MTKLTNTLSNDDTNETMNIFFPEFFLGPKKFVVCAKLQMGWKFHFSQLKTIFFPNIDKFLNFKEMKYLIHSIENVTSFILLCKLLTLFSTMNLKLEHNFSNSSIDSKFEFLNVDLRLCF